MRRVGIVGFGHIGQYLFEQIAEKGAEIGLEVCFVWNRTASKIEEHGKVPAAVICRELQNFSQYNADVIVEVAHPAIAVEWGPRFLEKAHFMCGSPTALADNDAFAAMIAAATKFGLYVPSGALWGAQDIAKMSRLGSLKGLKITMKKHPASLKVTGRLIPLVADACTKPAGEEVVVYEGSVRDLCPLAPNNVNTMAAAAVAASPALGFESVTAALVCNTGLETHDIVVEVQGGPGFTVKTTRISPSPPGAVSSTATYGSFLSSLRGVGTAAGVHMC